MAANGLKKTSPNPMVGCVIVKDNLILGEGWHHEYGKPHAEIEALNDAKAKGNDVRGATVYVTLEPCSHYGKTPPCADRLIQEGVGEVVSLMRDPNPKVNGQGLEKLKAAGIKVTELTGNLQEKSKWLNRGFIFVHKYKRPFINLKGALSLDGKFCLSNGESKWLTGLEARTAAHSMRAENDAVLVGVGTVLSDDPELTVRHVPGINPLRVVLDSNLRTPLEAKILGNDKKLIIFTLADSNSQKALKLSERGARIFTLPSMDLKIILEKLTGLGVLTLMVEGGPRVLSAFLKNNFADYINLFYAPKILGEGRGFELGMNFNSVSEALSLENLKSKSLGKDILIEGRLSCSPDL